MELIFCSSKMTSVIFTVNIMCKKPNMIGEKETTVFMKFLSPFFQVVVTPLFKLVEKGAISVISLHCLGYVLPHVHRYRNDWHDLMLITHDGGGH